jgi:hypothetical protein
VSALNIAAVTVVSIDELDVDDLQQEILISEKFSFTKINLLSSQIFYLLCLRWLLTKWPAASADMRDSSPASTVPHTILARVSAFSPGFVLLAPAQEKYQ